MPANVQSTAANNFFDHQVKAPSPFLMMLESRALLELGSFFQAIPSLKKESVGDGHPVVVMPGFMGGDNSTAPLRWFLSQVGFEAHAWGQGTNMTLADEISEKVCEKIVQLHQKTGKTVSVVGWSLGGVYARDAAIVAKDNIRHLITLGTPFARSMHSSPVVKFYESLNKKPLQEHDIELIARLSKPVQVPFTSIYSKLDGIVSWQCSISNNPAEQVEHIEVTGSHCGLGYNPTVLMTIAERLSQSQERWKPFDSSAIDRINTLLKKSSRVKSSNLADLGNNRVNNATQYTATQNQNSLID